MADTMIHRGPDHGDIWVDSGAGIAMAHRRLAILDLSPQGHQPMISVSGRYVVVFNGEIYNHRGLRADLVKENAPSAWKGHSDTEVMLAAFDRWGVEGSLERFNGMFAFALWDRKERRLHLARDRFGEKPLYYGWMGEVFLFGSELKALRAHPAWCCEIDRGSLALFMRYSYIPAPYSIYQEIFKLLPAHVLSLRFTEGRRELPRPRPYWSVRGIVEAGVRHPFGGNESEAISSLDTLLRDAVALRMEADVPLGAFLSGGIDSSTVVALMQAQSARPVSTFSIGFHETGYNEAEHAKAVARHIGTEHTELYITPEEAMAVIPRLPELYDEPFADPSQIPTFLVSQMTRQHVTVSLSGDAGDELFGGYNRYSWGAYIWNNTGWIPRQARAAMACGIMKIPPRCWDSLFAIISPILPRRFHAQLPGDKLHKLAGILACPSPEGLYWGLVSHWSPESVVIGASEPPTVLTDRAQWANVSGFAQRMMFFDLLSYLPDDILVKVDRASMGVSLEARVPLLDHRVVEFAWKLPLSMKIRDNQDKWILRQVLYKYVPKALIDRPKMGFGVPVDRWLRGPLRDWSEDLLNKTRLKREGFFTPESIHVKWREHLSERRNWAYHLWDVLMFQAWLDRTREGYGEKAVHRI
jgi:asparagine synthase (glutamine-hydrolysing)